MGDRKTQHNTLYYRIITIGIILLLIGTGIVSSSNGYHYRNPVGNRRFTLPTPTDAVPPEIIINYAGNQSDHGGPYWATLYDDYPLEQGELAEEGYYTNDSRQHEDEIYINVTVNGTGTEPTSVMLHWFDSANGWNNDSWTFIRTGSTGQPDEFYYEFNSCGNITTLEEGTSYSFDITAQDIGGNENTSWWHKTGTFGRRIRKYVQLNCTPQNISYFPYYFYEADYERQDCGKRDRFHHDQAADGTVHDTGYLLPATPADTVQFVWCSQFIGCWFDQSICVAPFRLSNIYFHFWYSSDTGDFTGKLGPNGVCWYKSRDHPHPRYQFDGYNATHEQSHSSLYYDNGEVFVSNQYYLNTHFLDVARGDYNFTDNDIYEFICIMQESPHGPSVITNRSFVSFIIFNVPDNTTLNTTYSDSDLDGLSDWTELYRTYTSPFLKDTDDDGVSDLYEHITGSDPNKWIDTRVPDPVMLEGACFNIYQEPVTNLTVQIINLNTSNHWSAAISKNSYAIELQPGDDIDPGDILRIIARNDTNLINVTEHTIHIDDIYSGSIHIRDTYLDIYYRDIIDFPMYHAEQLPDHGLQNGAAVGKMFLDYLTLLEYEQEWIYDTFKTYTPHGYWQTWYEDPENITAVEMMWGIGNVTRDLGYGFMTYTNTTPDSLLRAICVLIDMELHPQPGHPRHCPAAIPAYGTYNNWLVIRGIHTDRKPGDTTPAPEFTVYGFWVNDPAPNGIGENTYKTVDEVLATYFVPLTLPSGYENGNYTCVVEPPDGFRLSETSETQVNFAHHHKGFSVMETRLVQQYRRVRPLEELAKQVIFYTAMQTIKELAILDNQLRAYTDATPDQLILVRGFGANYYIAVFGCDAGTVAVRIDATRGVFLELSISDESPDTYLDILGIHESDQIISASQVKNQSPFYPQLIH